MPEPSLTQPADIAAALFDSTHVADGVVSLVDVMGVAVHDSAGAVLRPGADRGAGELVLTEDEVRGLIEMTQEDLPLQTEKGGPFPVADMYGALQPSLPADFTLELFLAAYNDAYAEEPEVLAAQVMRGEELEPDSGLLRVQMWLLLIDGFVGSATGAALPAFAQLSPGQTLGAARQNLPALTSPTPRLTNAEWTELIARLPTLPVRVPFEVVQSPGSIHEGHRGPGAPAQFFAGFGIAAPVISHRTGNTLLPAAPRTGLPVRWEAPDEPIWTQHGSFNQALGTAQLVNPGQQSGAAITFTPKKEDANGAGTELDELATLVARAHSIDLVSHSFDVSVLGAAVQLLSGTVRADGPILFLIKWHQLGEGYLINIKWTDVYDGIPDTIIFRGIADYRDTSVQGVDAYYTGEGVATGSRAGWKSCNPGIDVVPSGNGPAEFQAGVQGDVVTIAAFPSMGHPLAGILAGAFTIDAEGGTKEINEPPISGALCPHSIHALAEAIPFGRP